MWFSRRGCPMTPVRSEHQPRSARSHSPTPKRVSHSRRNYRTGLGAYPRFLGTRPGQQVRIGALPEKFAQARCLRDANVGKTLRTLPSDLPDRRAGNQRTDPNRDVGNVCSAKAAGLPGSWAIKVSASNYNLTLAAEKDAKPDARSNSTES